MLKRTILSIPPEMEAGIEAYRIEWGLKSTAEAMRQLIAQGLRGERLRARSHPDHDPNENFNRVIAGLTEIAESVELDPPELGSEWFAKAKRVDPKAVLKQAEASAEHLGAPRPPPGSRLKQAKVRGKR